MKRDGWTCVGLCFPVCAAAIGDSPEKQSESVVTSTLSDARRRLWAECHFPPPKMFLDTCDTNGRWVLLLVYHIDSSLNEIVVVDGYTIGR